MTTRNELLAAALEYAGKGWRVLPLRPRTKVPRLAGWWEAASDVAAEVRRWWAKEPAANVGVALGIGSDLVGVDVDSAEGSALLDGMADGDLPETCAMLTGKGRRYLYAIPPDLPARPRTMSYKGTDGREALRLQADGAQCVMPPSIHPDTKQPYRWVEGRSHLDRDAAPMPEWLAVEMTRPEAAAWADPPPWAASPTASAAAEALPGTDYNRRHPWAELLEAWGWRRAGRRGEVEYWTRPGKAKGVGATLGHYLASDGTPALYVFTSSADGLAAGKCYDQFGAYARLAHGGDFRAAAAALRGLGYGSDRHAPHGNGNGKPKAGPAAEAGEGGPQDGVAIIKGYYRDRYGPVFREGQAIHCKDGAVVEAGAAAALPTSEVIDQLAAASDAPRFPNGQAKRDSLPAFFRRWAPTAFADLLGELQGEDTADLAAVVFTRHAFRNAVKDALLTMVVLGDVYAHAGVTQTERRPLVHWCKKFALPGPWRDIRGHQCWCKLVADPVAPGGDELVLSVAIRQELFPQVKGDKRLRNMTPNLFASRAVRYGVGSSGGRADRPHGHTAVVLARDFVADLTAGLPADPSDLVDGKA